MVARLREERPEASALELDRIKQRAIAQAARPARASIIRPKGMPMKSKLVAFFAMLGLLLGGTGGVIAATGGDGDVGSAAKKEYKGGKKCGQNGAETCPPRAGGP